MASSAQADPSGALEVELLVRAHAAKQPLKDRLR